MTTIIFLLAPSPSPVKLTVPVGDILELRLPSGGSGAWWSFYDVDDDFICVGFGWVSETPTVRRFIPIKPGSTRFRAILARGNERPIADVWFEVTITEAQP